VFWYRNSLQALPPSLLFLCNRLVDKAMVSCYNGVILIEIGVFIL